MSIWGVWDLCGHLGNVGTFHLGLGTVENICGWRGSMKMVCRQLVCMGMMWTARKWGGHQWISREHRGPMDI